AMGTIPMIIAVAVMMTGRNRVAPASRAERKASFVSAKRSLAKVITSTLFAVATPILIMAPISAGTLSGVCVRKRIQQMPAIAPGKAVMMMKASLHDWKLTTSRK